MTKIVRPVDEIGRDCGMKHQKHFLDDAGRELLCKMYDGRTETITYLSEQLNAPRETVKWWAIQCGLTRPFRPWTAKEIEYLESYFGTKSLELMASRLCRRPGVVLRKAHELGLRKYDHGYTASSLSQALGVTAHTIVAWSNKGWLPSKRRKDNGAYYFTDKHVRDFIINHPEKISPTQDNWLWLVDVLSGGGIGELRGNDD